MKIKEKIERLSELLEKEGLTDVTTDLFFLQILMSLVKEHCFDETVKNKILQFLEKLINDYGETEFIKEEG